MKKGMPDWAQELGEQFLECFEDLSVFEVRYLKPKENEFEEHLFEIAPALMEIAQPTENDGEEVFSQNFTIDFLAIQKVFSKVAWFQYGLDEHRSPEITIEGRARRRGITVVIHTVPFDDADVCGRIGNGGSIELFDEQDQ